LLGCGSGQRERQNGNGNPANAKFHKPSPKV
jgi:hypothetical protein